MPGIATLSLWKIIVNDLAGRGYPQYKSFSAGLALVTTILLDLLLIPKYGIAGAAIASSISYTLSAFAILCWFCKVTGLKGIDILIPSISDIKFYRTLLRNRR